MRCPAGEEEPRSAPAQDVQGALPAGPGAEPEPARAAEKQDPALQRSQVPVSSGQPIDWSWDKASDRVVLGPRAAEVFGQPAGEPVAWTTLSELVHPEDREPVRLEVEAALRELADCDFEFRVNRPDGTELWIAVKGRGTYADDGTPTGASGAVQDISDRKRLEIVRRRLAAVVESSDDAIVSKTLDGTVLTWNLGATRIFGYTEEEMLGAPIQRLIPPELRAEEESILERQRRGERIDHYETVRVTKDGRRIDVSLTVSPMFDGAGRIVGASKVARDITARKRAEAELRQSKEELMGLADSIPQLAWMAHPDGSVFWFNRGWFEYTGTTLEQVQGWGWQCVHDESVLPRVLDLWRASLRSGDPFEMEYPLRGADGLFRAFLTRVRPIRDESGAVLRWLGTNTDVEEVKRAREALRDESLLLNLLNETGKSIAANLDLQALLQAIIDATTRLSGAEVGAFLSNIEERGSASVLSTLSGADRTALEILGRIGPAQLFASTPEPGPLRCDDVPADARQGWKALAGPSGGRPPIRSYLAAPVISRGGEVIGGLFFGHSLPGMFTERIERIITGVAAQAAIAIDNARLVERVKRAVEDRQELLDAERRARAEAERVSLMKDDFLATLSHELRTPLNAIVGWSHLLRTHGHVDAEVLEGLSVIERNAKVQARLIEDLLDMSRIVSGKVCLEVQPVDVQDVARAAIASVRHSAESRAVRVQVVLDPGAGRVRGDPSRLQQCFWNLLSNAIKFTPRGGNVRVSLARVAGQLEFTVQDDGQGIAPEFLPHVFERFRQADSSTTRHHGGLGLGLAIVKSLVEQHGGSVRASSAGVGRGATFSVHLPEMVEAMEDSGRQRAPPAGTTLGVAPEHPSLAGITVLLVDDEEDARALVKRILEGCGARVLVAESARTGLDLLLREKPDILISDIGLPGEDGYAFLRRVRALGPGQGGRIPAAALTAFARPEDRTRALRAGYQLHLSKPVDPTELTAAVASLATRP